MESNTAVTVSHFHCFFLSPLFRITLYSLETNSLIRASADTLDSFETSAREVFKVSFKTSRILFSVEFCILKIFFSIDHGWVLQKMQKKLRNSQKKLHSNRGISILVLAQVFRMKTIFGRLFRIIFGVKCFDNTYIRGFR